MPSLFCRALGFGDYQGGKDEGDAEEEKGGEGEDGAVGGFQGKQIIPKIILHLLEKRDINIVQGGYEYTGNNLITQY